jgi:hypothetical protein
VTATVNLDDHHIVAATGHEVSRDGTLREPGIDGEDPPLPAQLAQHVLQDRDLMGLVGGGLLPQSQPTRYCEEMGGWGALLAAPSQEIPSMASASGSPGAGGRAVRTRAAHAP